jgi:hypothetical protein
MRTLIAVAGLLVLGTVSTAPGGWYNGKFNVSGNSTTCQLNGASPSTCTATVSPSAICTCTPVGGTSIIAAGGCALGLSGTTLTATSANGLTNVVNIVCDR